MVRWPHWRPSNHEEPGHGDASGSELDGPSWFEAPLWGAPHHERPSLQSEEVETSLGWYQNGFGGSGGASCTSRMSMRRFAASSGSLGNKGSVSALPTTESNRSIGTP